VLYSYFWTDGSNWRIKASTKVSDIQNNGTPGFPGDDFLPSSPSTHFAASNTYNNTCLLSAENNRIYNFHRCINFNPTITISNDLGATWETPVPFIAVGTNNTRPYPRSCSNRTDRIDLIYTDGHPRDVNNPVCVFQVQTGTDATWDSSRIFYY
jgi:hypothetical protein